MRIVSRILLALLPCTFACKTTQVDGFTVFEHHYQRTKQEVLRRASFDLSCPPDQMKVKILGGSGDEVEAIRQYGVTGCDRAAVYVHVPNVGWVLDAERVRGAQPGQTAGAPVDAGT